MLQEIGRAPQPFSTDLGEIRFQPAIIIRTPVSQIFKQPARSHDYCMSGQFVFFYGDEAYCTFYLPSGGLKFTYHCLFFVSRPEF